MHRHLLAASASAAGLYAMTCLAAAKPPEADEPTGATAETASASADLGGTVETAPASDRAEAIDAAAGEVAADPQVYAAETYDPSPQLDPELQEKAERLQLICEDLLDLDAQCRAAGLSLRVILQKVMHTTFGIQPA